MNPRVIRVVPAENFTLIITFASGETRLFDVKPYLDHGVFRQLADPAFFASVRPHLGSIVWKGGQDLCPDTLYQQSRPLAAARRRAPTTRAATSRGRDADAPVPGHAAKNRESRG